MLKWRLGKLPLLLLAPIVMFIIVGAFSNGSPLLLVRCGFCAFYGVSVAIGCWLIDEKICCVFRWRGTEIECLAIVAMSVTEPVAVRVSFSRWDSSYSYRTQNEVLVLLRQLVCVTAATDYWAAKLIVFEAVALLVRR